MSTATTPDHPPEASPTRIDPMRCSSFAEFYPFYLQEHSLPNTRRLHFLGATLALAFTGAALWTGQWHFALYALLCGYGFAWLGHVLFEKNQPASFKRPLYSFMGDWVMYKDLWTGRTRF